MTNKKEGTRGYRENNNNNEKPLVNTESNNSTPEIVQKKQKNKRIDSNGYKCLHISSSLPPFISSRKNSTF